MKTRTQVIRENSKYRLLINAVLNRIGYNEYKGVVQDVNNYGANAGYGVFGFIRLIRIPDDSTLFIESILSGSCDAQYGELRFPYCSYTGLESILDVFIDFILTKVLNYGKKC